MNKRNTFIAWFTTVPSRLLMVVAVLVLLAALALAFVPSTVARAGMAPGGSSIMIFSPDGMAPGGSAVTNGMAPGGS